MAIVNLQAQGTNANSATSVSLAFGSNVALGSLIVICGMKFAPTSDPFVVGDCTKTAGTATIDTIVLDKQIEFGASSDWASVGIWSFLVTGAGSLTIQVGGAPAASFLLIGISEFSGSFSGSRVDGTPNSNTGTGLTQDSGSTTTTDDGLMVAAVQLNSSAATTINDDASFLSIYKNGTGTDDNGSAIYRLVTGPTTDTANWTTSGSTISHWSAAIVAYKEVAAAQGANVFLLKA